MFFKCVFGDLPFFNYVMFINIRNYLIEIRRHSDDRLSLSDNHVWLNIAVDFSKKYH